MHLSYITKLESQGVKVRRSYEMDSSIQSRVKAILHNKFNKRPKSAIKTIKQQLNKSEQFWVSPIKINDVPDVIHKNKSQPKKNFYVFPINEISKYKRNSTQTPSKTRIKTSSDVSEITENHILQGISKSLTNKYSTPKCRIYTEQEQIDQNQDSFLQVLQSKSGTQITNSLIEIYQQLPFELSITQQRELVRRIILEEANIIEKKNIQTQEWINKMSPTLKKQLIEDKTFWYPSTKINNNIIKNDMKTLFGVGNSRQLQPGEEASILEVMIQLIESQSNLLKILKSDTNDIFKQILQFQQLEYLQKYPLCQKQILYHWQLLITKMLCNEIQKSSDYMTNAQLIVLCKRKHALDLRSDRLNNLAQMLLTYFEN